MDIQLFRGDGSFTHMGVHDYPRGVLRTVRRRLEPAFTRSIGYRHCSAAAPMTPSTLITGGAGYVLDTPGRVDEGLRRKALVMA